MGITCGGEITIFVDLRSQVSTIRDQGCRPLCMTCAASDVHEAFHSTGYALSAEYLTYYCQEFEGLSDFSSGFGVETVSSVMTKDGQTSEIFHPYAINETTSAVKPPELGEEPIHFGKLVKEVTDIRVLKGYLDKNLIVLVGMRVTKDFLDVTSSDFIVSDNKNFYGLHAMVVVGYGNHNGKNVFLIRNSWGADWGYQGYAWISEEYLAKYCLIMAWVEDN